MMHKSKGLHIGKAPSLHLFHTAVRQRARELNLHPSMQLLTLCMQGRSHQILSGQVSGAYVSTQQLGGSGGMLPQKILGI